MERSRALMLGLAMGAVALPAIAEAQFLDRALRMQRADAIRRGDCRTSEVNPMQRCTGARHRATRHRARHRAHHAARRHPAHPVAIAKRHR